MKEFEKQIYTLSRNFERLIQHEAATSYDHLTIKQVLVLAEGINLLVKSSHPHGALIIMRSVFELSIRLIYSNISPIHRQECNFYDLREKIKSFNNLNKEEYTKVDIAKNHTHILEAYVIYSIQNTQAISGFNYMVSKVDDGGNWSDIYRFLSGYAHGNLEAIGTPWKNFSNASLSIDFNIFPQDFTDFITGSCSRLIKQTNKIIEAKLLNKF